MDKKTLPLEKNKNNIQSVIFLFVQSGSGLISITKKIMKKLHLQFIYYICQFLDSSIFKEIITDFKCVTV